MDAELSPVSSLQCVDALVTLGFTVADVDTRVAKLVGKNGRRIFVRRHCILGATELRAILIVAGIERDVFLEAVARRGSGTRRITEAPQQGAAGNEERCGASSGIRERGAVLRDVEDLLRKRNG